MKLGISALSALVVVAICYVLDVPTLAGADPLWADQVLLSGSVVGTILAILTLPLPGRMQLIGFSVLAIGAYLVAEYGRSKFAASYAEDTLAGQMWYFGWHALCIFVVAAVISNTYRQLGAR